MLQVIAQERVRGCPGAQVGEGEGRGVAGVWRVWRRTNLYLLEEGAGEASEASQGQWRGCGPDVWKARRGVLIHKGEGLERRVRRTALLRRCAGQGRGYAWVCSSFA